LRLVVQGLRFAAAARLFEDVARAVMWFAAIHQSHAVFECLAVECRGVDAEQGRGGAVQVVDVAACVGGDERIAEFPEHLRLARFTAHLATQRFESALGALEQAAVFVVDIQGRRGG
jgi:hypothetical protein